MFWWNKYKWFCNGKKKKRMKVQVSVLARLREIIYENSFNNNTFIIRNGTFNEYCTWNITPFDRKECHANVRFFSSRPEKQQNNKNHPVVVHLPCCKIISTFFSISNHPYPSYQHAKGKCTPTILNSPSEQRRFTGERGNTCARVPSVRANICWR